MEKKDKKTSNAGKSTDSNLSAQDIQAMIEKKAYELWLKNGGGPSKELQNWIEAERIIRGKSK